MDLCSDEFRSDGLRNYELRVSLHPRRFCTAPLLTRRLIDETAKPFSTIAPFHCAYVNFEENYRR